jgi:hypothetical protein
MDKEYNPGPEKKGQLDIPQCAGAAIFRANLGLNQIMLGPDNPLFPPEHFLILPPDTENVDASFAEFLARQAGISFIEAMLMLKLVPPHILVLREHQKVEGHPEKLHLMPRKKK